MVLGILLAAKNIMANITGVFTSRTNAELVRIKLNSMGFAEDDLILLSPGVSQSKRESVPTEEGEQPGMGKALGGVVGGAVGLAAGSTLATLFLSGVGPVVAFGLGAGGLGAATGATGGHLIETILTKGLPKDEVFFYEDALRQGRSILIALTADDKLIKLGRDVMESNDAESLDAAREKWWIGLRDAEAAEYSEPKEEFDRVEKAYRCGFEAAQEPELRGKTIEEARNILQDRFPNITDEGPFMRGFVRGQNYALKFRANDQRKGPKKYS